MHRIHTRFFKHSKVTPYALHFADPTHFQENRMDGEMEALAKRQWQYRGITVNTGKG